MKKKFLSIFAFLLISALSFAQNYNVDMNVSKSDLELNSYKRDSTANALVIYDYGNTFIDRETFWLKSQIKQKVKILRKEGIDLGVIKIKLYKGKSSSEKIENIIGTTYNLENDEIVRTQLQPSAIFKEENEDYTLVKLVLPNLKVGSVFTISYEKQSRFITKYQPWYFQSSNPVLYSEYNTSIPGNYKYHVKLVGGFQLDVNESKIEKNCLKVAGGGSADCAVSKYVMKNIPAYKQEGYTTTDFNYISRIEYELNEILYFDGRVDKISKTWKDVDKELKTDANFGRQVSKKSLIKNVLPKDISKISDKLEKAKAIYQFVQNNYKWNEKYDRYDVSVKKTVKEKIGNAFEINLLLENLLTSEGYTIYPVMISTRANGLPTKIYPVLTDFNYLILKATIDGKDYYLDATEPYLFFGELPYRCLNQYGRLMDFEDGSYWEDIKLEEYSTISHRISLNTFSNDEFNGLLGSKFSRYHAHNPKNAYQQNPISYKENKANKYKNIIIEDHDVIDTGSDSENFEETINFTQEPELIADKIYYNPFILKFFEVNPFKLQERTYPIDFGYKDSFAYMLNIDLGENLKVVELPESENYILPEKAGSFIFSTEVNDNKLTLIFKIKFSKAIYEPEYYNYLKIFMSKVVKIQNNTVIVLEKK
ncbi:DUF3857 domain-containing protein [Winogradskyella marincola]|uniref:DUF3857 domain-containing protein n=1 Tax=Winogradskyella marincola TaxID=3037795 RepID=A0ABT6G620_9FLAO|nr:DUF3857 domain-containing protein [Winogradskyella sp. YYF002]MDG4717254.1 DUF3857 domain-containing protein [Winogradskyella sp. YYF002]